MASLKITDIINETSLVEELSDIELATVVGGNHVTIVSCKADGTYTYTNGQNTWKAKPYWKWW